MPELLPVKVYVLVGVLLLFLLKHLQSADDANIPPYELNALQDLYDSTDGPNWVLPSDSVAWNFTADSNPCLENWQGINCTDQPVPPAIYRHVVILDLHRQRLRGTLPRSIGNLTMLEELVLRENFLKGQIPSEIGEYMTELSLLYLQINQLTGTIPISLGLLNNLVALDLDNCNISGSLPTALTNLPNLVQLNVGDNALTGTIPASLASMPQLDFLLLFGNRFEGAFPAEIQNMQRLLQVDVSNNTLSGTLSDTLCSIPHLTYIGVENNHFTGTIPDCIGNWSEVYYIDFSGNKFTGTIPDSLGAMHRLLRFLVYVNYFTGTIPASLGGLQNIVQLYAFDNYLTQTIPSVLGNLTSMTELYLQTNLLTGTIPPELGNATTLQLVFLEKNMFTGTVPPIFSDFPQLRELFLQSNRFHGKITDVFAQAPHASLQVVQLSENQFSGPLPEVLFDLPHLQTFAAAVNCITGTIPASLCNSTHLRTLILDGMQSASSCRTILLPSAHTYTVLNNNHGSIPACLFTDLPKLSALHLSGNFHTGTLPGDSHISASLIDLAVSHNALTGTIPRIYQHRPWSNLDLSYNGLTGELDPEFQVLASQSAVDLGNITYNTSGVTYALQNNRLSGKIPSALIAFTNVSMLGRNLFACKVDKSDLPKNDPNYYTYQCASNSFEYAYSVFLILVGGIAALLLFLLYGMSWSDPFSLKKFLLRALADWDLEREVSLRHVNFVRSVADILCNIGVSCTAIILVVLLPWYAIGSHFFKTYTHEYAWTVSAAFMSGLTPALIDLFLYFFMASFVAASAVYMVVRTDRARQRASSRTRSTSLSTVTSKTIDTAPEKGVPFQKRVLIYAAFFVVNLVAVVSMNLSFIVVALTQNNSVLLIAQIMLSSFKLLWNTVCTPRLIRLAIREISPTHRGAGFFTVQVLVALFNTILVPCFVVAAVSPSCFYTFFDSGPYIESSFVYQVPILPTTYLDRPSAIQLTDYVSYRPPSRYSYQCSSSFITYYAPAFVYLALTASVVTPAVQIAGLHWYKRATPGTVWFRVLDWTLITILKPPRKGDPPARIFDANIHVVSLITYLGILLTFGVVYPPLAVAMCAAIISVTWQAKLKLGRFLCNARAAADQRLVDTLERNCRGAVSLQKLRSSLSIVVCFCCVFYALFVFDTLGNEVGMTRALWSLVVMPLFPGCIAAALLLRSYLRRRNRNDDWTGFSVDENVFEMHTRRADDSISSRGLSEMAMSDMDSVRLGRGTSVSSVSSVGSARSANEWESAPGRERGQKAVMNALHSARPQSHAPEV